MSQAVRDLLDVMKRLREPGKGCPWDVAQDHRTLAKYLLEESYEVVEAIEDGDTEHLSEELGDVLLQIVFHAQIATENGHFTFDDVARKIADKMIERHPHVFGDREANTASDVLKNWEADKAKKRAEKAEAASLPHSILADVNKALPAISRALKLQQRAARVGFDWSNAADFVKKIREEIDELETEIIKGESAADTMESELGDLMFALVDLSRFLKIDPESALRRTNRKFESRFRGIESALSAQGRDLSGATKEELQNLWSEMKQKKKQNTLTP